MQESYASLEEPAPNKKDDRGASVIRKRMIGDWLNELRQSNFEGLSEPQLQVLQAPPFNICRDLKDVGQRKTAKVVSERRELLEKFQSIYGEATRPSRHASSGLSQEFRSLGDAIERDIRSLRYYATLELEGSRGKKKAYRPVCEEMIAMYRDLLIVEFNDPMNTDKTSLITAEELRAGSDTIRASDVAEGKRRSKRRPTCTADDSDEEEVPPAKRTRQSADDSDEEEVSPPMRTRQSAPTKGTKPTSKGCSTRDKPEKTSSASKKKAKSATAGQKWSKEEDEKLQKVVEKYGNRFAAFEQANLIPGRDKGQMQGRVLHLGNVRSDKQVKNYRQLLKTLRKTRAK